MQGKTVFMHVAETMQRGRIIDIRKNSKALNSPGIFPTLSKY